MTFSRHVVLSTAVVAVSAGVAPARAQAPAGSIAGRVVAAGSQTPVAGARITVIGTSRETGTRDDGRFTLSGVPAGTQRVRVTVLGYVAQEQTVAVTAGQAAAVTFTLQSAPVALSQVVVVGYGEQRREDVTGSVASVGATELAKTTLSTFEQGLQGRIAGVQVTQGDAAPGGGMRVQIRGVNSMNGGSAQPLYVIDGVPVASAGLDQNQLGARGLDGGNIALAVTNPLATLSPSDIESIDVLKDASATAIYGSRGANGVVIITTKKGSRGQGGQFALQYNQGFSAVTRELPVLGAPDYATYVNTSYKQAYNTPDAELPYGGRGGKWGPEQIRAAMGNGINWQDRIFHTGVVRDGQLTWSGGDDRGSYLVSGNLLDQGGVILGSQFRRGGVRTNLDREVNSRMRVQSNLSLTRSLNNMVRTATSTSYMMQGIVRMALTYVPMRSLNADTAQVGADPRAVDNETFLRFGATPDRYTDEVQDEEGTTRGLGNVKLVTDLGAGFKLDLGLAGNYERKDYSSYLPRTVFEGRNANGVAVRSGSDFTNLVSDNLLRFTRELGGGAHRVDAVGGFSYESSRSAYNQQQVQNFANDLLGSNALQLGGTVGNPFTDISTWKLASWLGRVNYSLLDRYNFTATVRRDGSSKFAANNKWATFTSAAFAWRALEESWLKGRTGPLNDLKFRASYGESGNQGISPYQSLAVLSGNSGAYGTEFAVSRLANPNLKWETTAQGDLGVDFALWDSRLTGTVDVYRKMTRDLLQQITVSPNTGFGSTWINSGNVRNQGVELQLGYDVLRASSAKRPTLNVTATAARNRNEIVSLGNGNTVQFANNIGYGNAVQPFIQKPGLPIGAIWGYTVEGIQKTQPAKADSARQDDIKYGGYRYVDTNGDGKINDDDRSLIGDANPDWTWGLSSRVTWRRFDVSALLTGVRGGNIINADRLRYLELNAFRNLPAYYVDRAWDPANPDDPSRIYGMIDNSRQGVRFSNYILEDASYVRLKNVQVGVSLRDGLVPGMRNARLYVNGINLVTWTKYTGFDPEVSAFGGSDRPGVDLGSYPQNRTVTLGVSTSF
jgi:TonB-linked SusC/RagA family outer membrane protein